jgi:putative redox protein
MTSEVIYKGALRTECKHLRSGNSILTDAPVDNKGKGETFSPTDLVATSLAACILTTIGIKLEEKGVDITGAKAEVEKVMASDPRRISEINMKIYMPAKNYSDKEKVLIEKIAKHCPVGRSLNADLKETMEIIWS